MSLPTIPVLASALTADHLPMIGGQVVDLVRVVDLREWSEAREAIEMAWVPVGAPPDAELRVSEYLPGDLISCVRRTIWQARHAGEV